MLGLVGGIVAVGLRLLARDGGSRPEQCLLALRHPIDAPEVVFGRGRVQVGEHLVQCDHLLDDGEKSSSTKRKQTRVSTPSSPREHTAAGKSGSPREMRRTSASPVPPSTVTSST